MTTHTTSVAREAAHPSNTRFVVETWKDQRSVRKIIAEELKNTCAPALGFEQLLRRLLQRQTKASPARVCYATVHERYEEMRARGEITETEAFVQMRKRSPFTQQIQQS